MRTTTEAARPAAAGLRHHGDAELAPGLVDCAVNVRSGTPPRWLRDRIAAAAGDLAAYPDARAATAAVAARHDRPPGEALVTAGGTEAFALLARALAPRRAVVVHPQFTEPEVALVTAGHAVERVLLDAGQGFRLDHGAVPLDADLVVVGNPTNPTGTLHPAATLAALARPGRALVVDEAFVDFVPGERESLAHRRDLPGLVVVRSLTKMWGLAGLRIGYLVGDPAVVDRLRALQPPWAVSTPALAAAVACCEPAALEEAEGAARRTAELRADLVQRLGAVPGVVAEGDPAANFVLLRAPGRPDVHAKLRVRGFAVRRCDTFPGLGPEWLRMTVREPVVQDALVRALRAALSEEAS
ncbi:MAG: Rv2231c family pyridoxal phosphate-dependent protein CobC [Frankiaceae bacterium]